MLPLKIRDREWFDDRKQEFVVVKGTTLLLEHSLISISKWESKWKKPFLGKEEKSYEETIDYIRCMTLNKNVDENVYLSITKADVTAVDLYINDTMTATWFNKQDEQQHKFNSQAITSELIYYWMVAFNIPFECEKWHLNRLFTLIHICEIKNTPSKKMKRKDIYARNRALNASRKQRLGTNG